MGKIIPYVILISFLTTAMSAQSKVVMFKLKFKKDTLVVSGDTILSSGSTTNAVFHPVLPLVLFTTRDENQNAVNILDLESHQHRIIAKGNSYSDLALTPDGKGVSTLQTNDVGHDLIRYSLDESPARVLIASVTFTDYAWVDDNSLVALFPGNPNNLRLLSIRPKKETQVAQNTGELLSRFFNTPSVTFIHKQSFTFSTVKRIGAKDGKIDVVIDTAPEQSIFTWTPSEILISTDGASLFSFNPKKDHDWKPVLIDSDTELKNISSLSVSSSGDTLVLTSD